MTLINKKSKNYFHGFIPKFFRTLRNEKYSKTKLKSDIIAGLTVAIVALPLSMALAIASGTTPDKGLFTAIVAGFIISFLGGSRFQVGGPTGAFVVVIYNIINNYGYNGLAVATILAGLILILAGFFKLGSMIKYIPYPVVTGFTAGIAVIIFSSQIKDLFGLNMISVPADFVEKWIAYFKAFHSTDKATLFVSLFTLTLMLVIRKFKPRWPFFLIGVVAGSFIVIFMHLYVDTIGTKFGGIPSSIPMPALPKFDSFDQIMQLIPSALTIAFLAGIESLLSAVVADSMTGDRHLSNCELVGEGLANVFSVIFGGIPATGAIARTATNIRSGANSSFAGMLHALFILLFMLLMAPLASYIPLASLGAVLVIVAWNMSGIERIRLLLTAQKGDRATMIVTFLLTVFVDLNTAIEVGVVMACLIFMHRMSNTFAVENDITLSNDEHKDNIDADDYTFAWPEGVVSIHISGPLFFGAASRLTEFFDSYSKPPKIVIMRMGSVPMVDASAINILIDFIKKCKQNDARLIISHAKPQPRKNIKREICKNRLNKYVLWTDKMPNALEIANTYLPKETQK